MKHAEHFGNCNIGLFSFIVFQTAVFAVILAYMIYTLKIELKSPGWLLVLIIVGAVFVPYYSGYLGVILRDNLYSYTVLLFLVELLYLLLRKAKFFDCTRHCLLLGLPICGSVWFRKKGIYMVFPTILLFFLYTMLQVKRLNRGIRNRCILKVFITLFMPIIFANGVSEYVMFHYQIEPGSIREALSLPFQQTARYALEYGNEITEEAAVISNILDYEHLAENYNPRISDPVKRTFNKNATREELKQYFVVWVKQFFKHPLVYVKATLNQNYYILYPYTENDMIYTRIAQGGSSSKIVEELSEKLDIYEPVGLIPFKITIEAFYKMLFVLPVFGVLSSLAFYNILLIFCFSFSIQCKQYKWILLSMPLILTDITIILAPAILVHPRYAFPIFYATPVVIAYYIYLVSA